MPVEIKELIIRAVVRQSDAIEPAAPAEEERADREQAIVETCVKQVLRILKKSKER